MILLVIASLLLLALWGTWHLGGIVFPSRAVVSPIGRWGRFLLVSNVLLLQGATCIAIVYPHLLRVQGEAPLASTSERIYVVDISLSMLARDTHPSRLESAKELLWASMQRFPSDPHALIVFAGVPALITRPTLDHDSLREILSAVHPDMIDQGSLETTGTNITDALLLASTLGSGRDREIVLISDGEANVGIDPLRAAPLLSLSGADLSVVLVGTASGGKVVLQTVDGRERVLTDRGEALITRADRSAMERVAQGLGGVFFSSPQEMIASLPSATFFPPDSREQLSILFFVLLLGLIATEIARNLFRVW